MLSRPTPSSSSSLLPSSLLFLSVLLLSVSFSSSFYLPGVAPNDYKEGEAINVKAIKLDSVKTQLPYDYYSLPFCRPYNDKILQEEENLGEVLSGDQIETSPYTVVMKYSETCKVLCVKDYTEEELQQLAERIEEEYRVNWLLDNIPAATKYYTVNVLNAEGEKSAQSEPIEHYEKGYALGFVGHTSFPNSKPGVKYINNHLRLNIKFHHEEVAPMVQALSQTVAAAQDGVLPGATETAPSTSQSSTQARIVGFEIEAYSVHHVIDKDFTYKPEEMKPSDLQDKLVTCRTDNADTKPQPVSDFEKTDDKRIIFTYDVQWEKSDIKCQPQLHSSHYSTLSAVTDEPLLTRALDGM